MIDKYLASMPLCNWGGIFIVAIDDETVTSVFDFGDGAVSKYTVPLRYDENGNAYFVRYGIRYNVSDFIKNNNI